MYMCPKVRVRDTPVRAFEEPGVNACQLIRDETLLAAKEYKGAGVVLGCACMTYLADERSMKKGASP